MAQVAQKKEFELHFDEGFFNSLVEVHEKGQDSALYKGVINTNKALGFAKSLKLTAEGKWCIIFGDRQFPVITDSTRFAYISLVGNELKIRYSNKKKLYE